MILFLDDSPDRTKRFCYSCPSSFCAETAQEMIELFKKNADQIIEYVFLDHDLGSKTFVSSAEADTGMEVVRWIVQNRPKIKQIVVHTMNSVAGPEMVKKLQNIGYSVQLVPFHLLNFDMIKDA
jgi:ActR/RegA family two-component response regulator